MARFLTIVKVFCVKTLGRFEKVIDMWLILRSDFHFGPDLIELKTLWGRVFHLTRSEILTKFWDPTTAKLFNSKGGGEKTHVFFTTVKVFCVKTLGKFQKVIDMWLITRLARSFPLHIIVVKTLDGTVFDSGRLKF